MQGKVAIVTGGASGVGLGIARRFLEEGAAVVTCSRRAFDPSPAADGLGDPERTVHVPADVRDFDAQDRIVATALERYGRLDVLVNNAGGSPVTDISTVSPRFLRSVIELNLTAPFAFSQKANAVMQKQESGGNILNISTMGSVSPSAGLAAYGAAKAGLNHVTQALALAWGPKVRVNCIPLGYVLTEAMAAELLPENRDAWKPILEGIPMRRMGEPEEIGDLCIFLASEKASYLSGAIIYAHGGGFRGAQPAR